jgi:hypothetical protein
MARVDGSGMGDKKPFNRNTASCCEPSRIVGCTGRDRTELGSCPPYQPSTLFVAGASVDRKPTMPASSTKPGNCRILKLEFMPLSPLIAGSRY